MERSALKKAIGKQESVAKRLGFVASNTLQRLFEDVHWMGKNDKIMKYLWSHSKKNRYESGEFVCLKDEVPEGVYVIISGR